MATRRERIARREDGRSSKLRARPPAIYAPSIVAAMKPVAPRTTLESCFCMKLYHKRPLWCHLSQWKRYSTNSGCMPVAYALGKHFNGARSDPLVRHHKGTSGEPSPRHFSYLRPFFSQTCAASLRPSVRCIEFFR